MAQKHVEKLHCELRKILCEYAQNTGSCITSIGVLYTCALPDDKTSFAGDKIWLDRISIKSVFELSDTFSGDWDKETAKVKNKQDKENQ